jgi:hypothetical protein
MSKAFWIGSVLTAIGVGLALGSYSHPYEQCARMYNSPENIGECVWIKQND